MERKIGSLSKNSGYEIVEGSVDDAVFSEELRRLVDSKIEGEGSLASVAEYLNRLGSSGVGILGDGDSGRAYRLEEELLSFITKGQSDESKLVF